MLAQSSSFHGFYISRVYIFLSLVIFPITPQTSMCRTLHSKILTHTFIYRGAVKCPQNLFVMIFHCVREDILLLEIWTHTHTALVHSVDIMCVFIQNKSLKNCFFSFLQRVPELSWSHHQTHTHTHWRKVHVCSCYTQTTLKWCWGFGWAQRNCRRSSHTVSLRINLYKPSTTQHHWTQTNTSTHPLEVATLQDFIQTHFLFLSEKSHFLLEDEPLWNT